MNSIRAARLGQPSIPRPGHRPVRFPITATYIRGAGALRERRQGRPRPPAPPAQGAAPGNPDLIHSFAKRLARMPLVCRNKQNCNDWLDTPGACAGALHLRTSSHAGGLGARCAQAGGARGAARSHPRNHEASSTRSPQQFASPSKRRLDPKPNISYNPAEASALSPDPLTGYPRCPAYARVKGIHVLECAIGHC
jgi:hypothetical protein